MHHLGNAHLYTALAYYVIGLVLLGVSIKIWWTHPVNRALIFGPYVTQEGMKLILRNWPFMAMFGAFILSCAFDHHADWLASRGTISYAYVDILSIIEAMISVWTAGSMVFVALRAAWRSR